MSIKVIVEHKAFSSIIMVLIILNAFIIGLETYPSLYEPNIHIFTILDRIFLLIFSLEIILKIITYRSKYFRNGWDVLDFSIVLISVIFYTTNLVSILRLVRVLRVLRTITAIPSLRRLVSALLLSIPAMVSTLLLMLIVYYIYGIIGTTFFATISPEYFGDLPLSLLTLFQVFTLESWASGVFRPIFAEYTWSWIYFVTFILISAFIIANLFFGELVNNAQKLSKTLDVEEDVSSKKLEELKSEIIDMKIQNQRVNERLDTIIRKLEGNK